MPIEALLHLKVPAGTSEEDVKTIVEWHVVQHQLGKLVLILSEYEKSWCLLAYNGSSFSPTGIRRANREDMDQLLAKSFPDLKELVGWPANTEQLVRTVYLWERVVEATH